MFYTEVNVKQRPSIWSDTSAQWDDRDPTWKAVGKHSFKATNTCSSEIRRVFVQTILENEIKLYQLQFSSGRQILAESKHIYAFGTYVIVKADRGEDCGQIVGLQENVSEDEIVCKYCENQNNCDQEMCNVLHKTKVLRVATNQDVNLLKTRTQQEEIALNKCLELASGKNYSMEIIKCEYQWDMNKITFYFRSQKRIDFRDLVKDLFKYFKIRIWMSMENKKG